MVPLLLRHVLPVVLCQQRRNARVLVLQRAPVDLRRVRRQHNLHVLLGHCRRAAAAGQGGGR